MTEENHAIEPDDLPQSENDLPEAAGETDAGDDGAQSIGAWINRARRAQELVAHVDLQRVASHDDAELEKLGRVTGALDALSRGEDVDVVPGVDDEPPPELDPEQVRRSHLMSTLDAAGYGDRVGRLRTGGADDPFRPLDLVPHREGLPAFDFCLAPDESRSGCAMGIFISAQGVFAAEVFEPFDQHRWRIIRSRPYEDEREMLTTIAHFMTDASD